MIRIVKFSSFFLLVSLVLFSCKGDKQKKKVEEGTYTQVTLRIANDPDNLHPYNANSMEAFSINGQFYQSLTAIDFKTLKMVPVLADNRAKIEKIPYKNGIEGLSFTFTIRNEAKWDDGKDITAKDIEFSLKAMKNPFVNDEPIRLAYSDIDSVVLYPNEPKKISIISTTNTIRSEAAVGGFVILPKHIIDSAGLMDDVSVSELNREDALNYFEKNEKVKLFAEWFNSDKFTREAKYLTGSGAYVLESWSAGQRLVLKRKSNWWGDAYKDINTYFEANPNELIYKVFSDANSAVNALKSNKLDVMSDIPPLQFIALQSDENIKKNYNLYTPDEMGYTCITLNLKSPKLSDIKVRHALAHLLNYDVIIGKIMQNTARQTLSMEHPVNKATYNSDIKPFEYNPKKARKLLEEAGWGDKNQNGILDKTINGKLKEFRMDLLLNTGNSSREKIAVYLKEEARKIGIEINIIPMDLSLLIQRQREHDFEMAFNGWISSALPYDPKQVWHTEAIKNGHNFMSFGNQETDRLIDSIRVELDEQKRILLFKKFQAMVYQEQPVLYLYALKGRLAINKRFENAYPSSLRPGYNETGFRAITK